MVVRSGSFGTEIFDDPVDSSLLGSSLSGGLQAFRGFLRSEFSEENLQFWLACEDYRVSPSKTKASSIYSQFINPDAPQEVSGQEWH